MTPIKRRYTVQVDPHLVVDADVTIAHGRLVFEIDMEGLTDAQRQWIESHENTHDIGEAVADHHHKVELEAWAKLTEGTSNE